jgi:uncharacterized protein
MGSGNKPQTVTSSQVFLERLEGELSQIPWARQLAFAASCCERAFPNYVIFSGQEGWGDPAILRQCLDKTWNLIEGEPFPADQIRELKQRCEAATPDADDFESSMVGPGQEAAFCVHLLLDLCLERDPRHAVRISTWARDTIDSYVQHLENIDVADPEREQRIEGHPLMREELERQQSDLAYLKRADVDLSEFKRRATRVTKSNIGLL